MVPYPNNMAIDAMQLISNSSHINTNFTICWWENLKEDVEWANRPNGFYIPKTWQTAGINLLTTYP